MEQKEKQTKKACLLLYSHFIKLTVAVKFLFFLGNGSEVVWRAFNQYLKLKYAYGQLFWNSNELFTKLKESRDIRDKRDFEKHQSKAD